MPHSSLAIANEFLSRAHKAGRDMTHMQLQKLVYLAHGWNLAVNGDLLTRDDIEAWSYGPVIRRLYDALTKFGRAAIPRLIRWGEDTPFSSDDDGPAIEDFSTDEKAVLDSVWDNYGSFPAFKLSALTHEPNTPWHAAFQSGRNKVISPDSIKAYFVELANAPAGNAAA